QRLSTLEVNLDGASAGGTGGVCFATRSQGAEDAYDVVRAPGPERPAADLDPVAVRQDAQTRRAGDLALVVQANPASSVQLGDALRDPFDRAAQIGGESFDAPRRARGEQPPEGGSTDLPGQHRF